MNIEVKVPVFPESVNDGTLVNWHKQLGEEVAQGDIVADIETDKVVFEVPAPVNGKLAQLLVDAGTTVLSGQVIAKLESAEKNGDANGEVESTSPKKQPQPTLAQQTTPAKSEIFISPSARKLIFEKGLPESDIKFISGGGRIHKEDVKRYLEQGKPQAKPLQEAAKKVEAKKQKPEPLVDYSFGRKQERVPMTRLRARVAERLLDAQHNNAILTTFNEVNMGPIKALRTQYKEKFEKEYGVRLGFMSFFVRACVDALKKSPMVNASVDGDDVVYHGFYDIGIAVGSPRGLVVPILRDADQMSLAEIEKGIDDYAERAQTGALNIEELTGGTFTITNGGVFGSLLSTPILNPPQSAILGMHKIEERPMAEDGKVVIRSMMYLALSYDHRLVDGKEAVQFLVTIKEMLEEPTRLLLEV